MCLSADWNTVILTTITSAVTAGLGAWAGAKLAFSNDKQLAKEERVKNELQWIYAYYGHLLSLFNGYDNSADSFISILNNGGEYHIENNISKIQNDSNDKWGNLGFITTNSLKLYELTFLLERHVDILIEKAEIYKQHSPGGTPNYYTIALRQYLEVYAEIIAMIDNFNRFAQTYYSISLMENDFKTRLQQAKDKVSLMVQNIDKIKAGCTLGDKEDFLKRMEDKSNWYLTFDNKKGNINE